MPGVAVLAAASPNNLLFPEYELVTESENSMESDKPEKTDAEKIAEYKEYMTAHQEPLLSGKDSTRDLEDMATGDVDKQFSKFKKRIDHEPEQVWNVSIQQHSYKHVQQEWLDLVHLCCTGVRPPMVSVEKPVNKRI